MKRNRVLRCEGECKIGYIESSDGVCSSCNSISKGCHECHYDEEYPIDYKGIHKKRRFVCDYCEEGYMQSSSGECLDCENLGLDNCLKCKVDLNNNENYICIKCLENFFVNEKGQCQTCDNFHFKGINKTKFFECGNVLEGGINKCLFCETDGKKVTCKQCLNGYILLTNNNSCLEVIHNKELHKFSNCNQLTIENNKLLCEKCNYQYSLFRKNDITECVYIKSLYDKKFDLNYGVRFYVVDKRDEIYESLIRFYKNDYIFNRYNYYYPCQEAENIGTEDNPLYSCKKCYEHFFGSEYFRNSVKITEEISNVSYCINPINYEELKDCSEAKYKIKKGKEIFNCTQCRKKYLLTLNKDTNSYYCKFSNATIKCLVLYCKICNSYDGYICEECFPDYEINSLTGSCVKKTEIIPAITWKDIYRLDMNGEKIINNRYIYGPTIRIRGITSNKINSRHAFLIYLIFNIKHLIRNLEVKKESIRIPSICEIMEEVEEVNDDVNMVEYECIGNLTNQEDLSNYKLEDIEEGDNKNVLKKTNLNELVSKVKSELRELEQLNLIQESSFNYDDVINVIIFQMNEKIDYIKANNFEFNFKIEGKLNKELSKEKIILNREFEIVEIKTKANCIFVILNKNANLSCQFNAETHKNIKTFSFKTSQINTDTNEIFLNKFNDILLINSEIEGGENSDYNNDHKNTTENNDDNNNTDNDNKNNTDNNNKNNTEDVNGEVIHQDNNDNNSNNENDNKNKIGMIIGSVICGIIGFSCIGIGIYCLLTKFKYSKGTWVYAKNNINEEFGKNYIPSDNNIIYQVTSEEK